MTEWQLQAVRAGGFLAAFLSAVILQRLAPHARLRGSWRVNGAFWLLDTIVVGAVCGACGFTAARWAARAGFGLFHQAEVGQWAAIPATVSVLDAVSYGWHRANHRVGPLWRFHQVHHSDSRFTVSTGVRFHPGELLLSLPIRLGAVVLIGAPLAGVVVFEIAFTFSNLIEHGDINLPPRVERILARVCITPALHRRHHTKVGPERDTNFGTVFSLWDRVFGTLTPSESATKVETGLPGMDDLRLSHLLVLPLR